MFNAPMSLERADYLIKSLNLSPSSHIVDLGCGKGHFLRLIGTQYPVTGVGVDTNPDLVQEANENWANETSKSDVKYISTDAIQYLEDMSPVDTIVCVGAEYIFAGFVELLQKAKDKLKPNGKILVGLVYWRQAPSTEYLELMDGLNPYFDIFTTVKLARDEDYIPLEVIRANIDEWDIWESYTARRRYLSDDPAIRKQGWRWHGGYLKWGIDTMGFCYLVLQKSQ